MVLPWRYWGGAGRGVDALGAPGLPILPPPPPRPLRCLEDCGHGVCSGPPDFTCVCDLGWTSDLPPPTPAPGPPAPRCSRDCGCNFHSHCHKRGPGFCDECQGEQPALVHSSGALRFDFVIGVLPTVLVDFRGWLDGAPAESALEPLSYQAGSSAWSRVTI